MRFRPTSAWGQLRRTHCEHMFSGLLPNSDIGRCSRHFAFVPHPDMQSGPSAAISSDRLSSGNIKTDYIDPVRTSANWKPPQIANLHRQGGPKLLHRRAGCEKAPLNTTTEFLKPRGGVHDITVK